MLAVWSARGGPKAVKLTDHTLPTLVHGTQTKAVCRTWPALAHVCLCRTTSEAHVKPVNTRWTASCDCRDVFIGPAVFALNRQYRTCSTHTVSCCFTNPVPCPALESASKSRRRMVPQTPRRVSFPAAVVETGVSGVSEKTLQPGQKKCQTAIRGY